MFRHLVQSANGWLQELRFENGSDYESRTTVLRFSWGVENNRVWRPQKDQSDMDAQELLSRKAPGTQCLDDV